LVSIKQLASDDDNEHLACLSSSVADAEVDKQNEIRQRRVSDVNGCSDVSLLFTVRGAVE